MDPALRRMTLAIPRQPVRHVAFRIRRRETAVDEPALIALAAIAGAVLGFVTALF